MMKKKIFGLLLCAMACFGGIGVVNAATSWTNDVTFYNIPGGGNYKTNYNKPNTKTTNTQTATFKATKMTAALGNSARVVNSNGDLRSDWVGLSKNSSKYAKEKNAAKNFYFYARVKSNTIEWGNNNDVVLNFSADKK